MSIQKQNYDYLIEPTGNYPSFIPGQGIKGSKGNTGNQGAKGPKGTPGTASSKGQKGSQGVVGLQGAKGQKGATSSTVFNFEGQVDTFVNLPAVGNVEGDVYQTTDTGNLYVWDGTQWLLLAGSVNDLKGDKGDAVKGQKGADGPKGDKGAPGVNAAKGQKGDKGTTPSTDEFVTKSVADATYAILDANNTMTGVNTFQRATSQASIIVKRSENNTTDNGGSAVSAFQVTGGQKGSQNLQSQLLKSYNYPQSLVDGAPNPAGQPQSDYIRYFGRTDVSDSIQTKSSCDNRYVTLGTSQSILATKNFNAGATFSQQTNFYNSSSNNNAAIQIRDSTGATIGTGVGWFSSGNVKCGSVTQEVNTTEANTFYKITGKGDITLESSNKLVINRGTAGSSTGGLVINGMTSDGDDANILDCFYNNGTVGDAVNYHGKTDGANNLQNLTSLQSYVQGGAYTISNGVTISGTNTARGLVISDASNPALSEGAIKFKDANANADVGQDTYVLIQGRGNTTAGNLVFARDTTVGNVSNSDIWFKLQAPRSGTGSHDVETIFVQPVQGPTPTQGADLTTKDYVDGGDWITVSNGSDIGTLSTIQYRIAGKTVQWKMDIRGSSVLTNGTSYCTVPAEARPPINTIVQLMPAFNGSNSNGTFVTIYFNASTGAVLQLSNDKPIGSASETATINNSFISSSGPPSATGVFSYPID